MPPDILRGSMPQPPTPSESRRSPLAQAAARLGRPLRLAHRGLHAAGAWRVAQEGSAGPPENSLAAFVAADHLGLDGIECDLRVSNDGETVIVHDADLRRTHSKEMLVSSSSARDLAALGIPRIDDLLAACSPTLLLDLELKAPPAPSLFAALRSADRGPGDGVVFSSFDLDVLAALRASAPEWCRWLNIEGDSSDAIARALTAECVGIAVDAALCKKRLEEDAASAGLELAVWTLRSGADLARLEEGEWPTLVAACVEGEAAVAAR